MWRPPVVNQHIRHCPLNPPLSFCRCVTGWWRGTYLYVKLQEGGDYNDHFSLSPPLPPLVLGKPTWRPPFGTRSDSFIIERESGGGGRDGVDKYWFRLHWPTSRRMVGGNGNKTGDDIRIFFIFYQMGRNRGRRTKIQFLKKWEKDGINALGWAMRMRFLHMQLRRSLRDHIWHLEGGEKSEIEGTRAGARIDKCSRDEFGKVGDNHKTGAKKEEREKWISRTFPPLHLDSFRPLEMGVIPSRKLLRATLKGLKVYLPRCWCWCRCCSSNARGLCPGGRHVPNVGNLLWRPTRKGNQK